MLRVLRLLMIPSVLLLALPAHAVVSLHGSTPMFISLISVSELGGWLVATGVSLAAGVAWYRYRKARQEY